MRDVRRHILLGRWLLDIHILELGLDLHLRQFGPHAHGRDISFLIALPEPALVLFHYLGCGFPVSFEFPPLPG